MRAVERHHPLARGLFAGLACAAALLLQTAPAAAQSLTPFEASYAWSWHGAEVAVSTLKLEPGQGDNWIYSSHSEPRGIGVLYPMRPRMRSEMRVSDQGVQPLSYHATDGTSANQRGAEVSFDWQAGRATGSYQGVPVDLALKSGAQDDLSIQIALLLALRQGKIPGAVSLLDKNSLRDYSYQREGTETITTRLGKIETVVYASHHEGSPRTTRFWCAPSKGYLPMRVQQKRLDSVEWTMEIETLKGQ
jgi:uncharacterized protein DUF3108